MDMWNYPAVHIDTNLVKGTVILLLIFVIEWVK
jgi:hypothetical protein